jgi:hypothetical protein
VCKISSQSNEPFNSYRVNGWPDTLTNSIVHSLFESNLSAVFTPFDAYFCCLGSVGHESSACCNQPLGDAPEGYEKNC